MTIKTFFANSKLNSIFFGILGGIALIWGTQLTTNGPAHLIPYPIFLILAIGSLGYCNGSAATLAKLFSTGLITFLVMSAFLYLFINRANELNSDITFFGHLWRVGFLIVVASVSRYIVSIVTKQFVKQ